MREKKFALEGQILKNLRAERTKLSQAQFARSINIDIQVIRSLEQGWSSCHNLKYGTLKSIANGLLETTETLTNKLKGV